MKSIDAYHTILERGKLNFNWDIDLKDACEFQKTA